MGFEVHPPAGQGPRDVRLNIGASRPAWFTSDNEVDFGITHKGEPERGSAISQKSLATSITQIIELPEKYARESLGSTSPGKSAQVWLARVDALLCRCRQLLRLTPLFYFVEPEQDLFPFWGAPQILVHLPLSRTDLVVPRPRG